MQWSLEPLLKYILDTYILLWQKQDGLQKSGLKYCWSALLSSANALLSMYMITMQIIPIHAYLSHTEILRFLHFKFIPSIQCISESSQFIQEPIISSQDFWRVRSS